MQTIPELLRGRDQEFGDRALCTVRRQRTTLGDLLQMVQEMTGTLQEAGLKSRDLVGRRFASRGAWRSSRPRPTEESTFSPSYSFVAGASSTTRSLSTSTSLPGFRAAQPTHREERDYCHLKDAWEPEQVRFKPLPTA